MTTEVHNGGDGDGDDDDDAGDDDDDDDHTCVNVDEFSHPFNTSDISPKFIPGVSKFLSS